MYLFVSKQLIRPHYGAIIKTEEITMTTDDILELAQAMTEAESKEELTLIKSRYSEEIIKQAWGMLDEPIKRRLKSYCDQPESHSRLRSSLSNSPSAAAMGMAKPLVKTEKPVKATPKLWELSAEVIELENSIAEIIEDELLSDSEKEALLGESIELWLGTGKEFDSKACNVAAYIKHLEALTEARKNEYRRLRELAEQSEKQAEKLRSYLVLNMQKLDKKKISGVSASLSLRKKPSKVILNVLPEQLPEQFKKVEVTPKLSAIKDYLKVNPSCEFAQMSESLEYSITIK